MSGVTSTHGRDCDSFRDRHLPIASTERELRWEQCFFYLFIPVAWVGLALVLRRRPIHSKVLALIFFSSVQAPIRVLIPTTPRVLGNKN